MAAGSRNPHLIGMKEDMLYHIGIKADTSTQEIREKFGDVKVPTYKINLYLKFHRIAHTTHAF